MDLSTTYLGLNLPHPIMPGASPMVDHLDLVKRLEDAGAAAITMHSLFEEQITREQLGMVYHMELLDHGSSEALSYFPQAGRVPPRAVPVPRADPAREADGEAAGHRVPERHDARRAGWSTRSSSSRPAPTPSS